MKPIGSQVAATILAVVGLLVFNLLFSAFFSHGLFTWQVKAVTNASLLIVGGIVAAIWIKWGVK